MIADLRRRLLPMNGERSPVRQLYVADLHVCPYSEVLGLRRADDGTLVIGQLRLAPGPEGYEALAEVDGVFCAAITGEVVPGQRVRVEHCLPAGEVPGNVEQALRKLTE